MIQQTPQPYVFKPISNNTAPQPNSTNSKGSNNSSGNPQNLVNITISPIKENSLKSNNPALDLNKHGLHGSPSDTYQILEPPPNNQPIYSSPAKVHNMNPSNNIQYQIQNQPQPQPPKIYGNHSNNPMQAPGGQIHYLPQGQQVIQNNVNQIPQQIPYQHIKQPQGNPVNMVLNPHPLGNNDEIKRLVGYEIDKRNDHLIRQISGMINRQILVNFKQEMLGITIGIVNEKINRIFNEEGNSEKFLNKQIVVTTGMENLQLKQLDYEIQNLSNGFEFITQRVGEIQKITIQLSQRMVENDKQTHEFVTDSINNMISKLSSLEMKFNQDDRAKIVKSSNGLEKTEKKEAIKQPSIDESNYNQRNIERLFNLYHELRKDVQTVQLGISDINQINLRNQSQIKDLQMKVLYISETEEDPKPTALSRNLMHGNFIKSQNSSKPANKESAVTADFQTNQYEESIIRLKSNEERKGENDQSQIKSILRFRESGSINEKDQVSDINMDFVHQYNEGAPQLGLKLNTEQKQSLENIGNLKAIEDQQQYIRQKLQKSLIRETENQLNEFSSNEKYQTLPHNEASPLTTDNKYQGQSNNKLDDTPNYNDTSSDLVRYGVSGFLDESALNAQNDHINQSGINNQRGAGVSTSSRNNGSMRQNSQDRNQLIDNFEEVESHYEELQIINQPNPNPSQNQEVNYRIDSDGYLRNQDGTFFMGENNEQIQLSAAQIMFLQSSQPDIIIQEN